MANGETLLKDKNILWVEDDPFLSDLVIERMKTVECNLTRTQNSDETFKALSDGNPDMIILDILLPGENGYEILEKLKADENFASIPVVILSNFGQQSDIEKGLKLGAEKYLIKATLTLNQVVEEIGKTFEEITSN